MTHRHDRLQPICHVCNGLGIVKLYGRDANGHVRVATCMPCERCDGTGRQGPAPLDRLSGPALRVPLQQERRS